LLKFIYIVSDPQLVSQLDAKFQDFGFDYKSSRSVGEYSN
jgi:hypothetical protein